MLSKIFLTLTFLIIYFLNTTISFSNEELSFNVTEIEILEDGNKIKGSNGGDVFTKDGLKISATNFL